MSGYDRVTDAVRRLDLESPDLTSIRTAAVGTARDPGDIRMGKDALGNLHLLLVSPAGFARMTPGLGPVFPASWDSLVSAEGSSFDVLDIMCTDERFLPTFHSLVGELLDRVDQSGREGIVELFEVIGSWRRAIETASKQIGRSLEVGLFGELLVLSKLAEIRPDDALMAWRGSDQHRHDFSLENAVEVKAYTGVGSPRVEIHGARQLDPPTSGRLTLVAFHLEETASGRTLEDLIRDASAVIPEQNLRRRLGENFSGAAGELRHFEVLEVKIFDVDERFPGIRESQLAPHALSGVENLRYTLILDTCPPPLENVGLADVLREL